MKSAFIVFLPFLLFQPPQDAAIQTKKVKHTSDRGIYITYWISKTPSRFAQIKRQAIESSINTLVIDAKEILSQPLLSLIKDHKLSKNIKVTPESWLKDLTDKLHEEGFIVTARLVTFKDDHLVLARPDLGVKVHGGGLYRDNKGGKWADPYSDEVRLYNELIAERAALSGFDEVQFDYVRFPAEGAAHNAFYPFEKKEFSKVDTICFFLEAVKKRIAPYRVSIAVDIFGITAWQSKNDIENLGQDLARMAKYIDALSPMLYPSHFHSGYDGFANPGSHPYYFMNAGIKKIKEILSGEAVSIIPWIQGFNLRSPNFGPNYIQEQINACKDEGINKYLIWNARNVYDIPFAALKNKLAH